MGYHGADQQPPIAGPSTPTPASTPTWAATAGRGRRPRPTPTGRRAPARPSTTSSRRCWWTTPTPPGRLRPRRGRTPARRRCGTGSIKAKKNKSTARSAIDMVLLNDELYRQFADADRQGAGRHPAGRCRDDADSGSASATSSTTRGRSHLRVRRAQRHRLRFQPRPWSCVPCRAPCSTTRGRYENENDKTVRWSIDFFGNLRFASPRYFVKWKNYG
jgi:hypothetical protein